MDLLPALADRPDSTVTVNGRTWTFGELAAWAEAVASSVDGMRVIAVEASPTLETVATMVGALMAGVTVVPVPPDAGPLERQHILRDSRAEPPPPPQPPRGASFSPRPLDPT